MVKRVFIILIAFAALFISGCSINENIEDIESKKTAITCVEDDEDLLLEMFDIFDKNNIEDIGFTPDSSINILYNDKNHITIEQNEMDSLDKDLLRACEILEELFTVYGINDIHHYSDIGGVEIRFLGNSRAIYFSPDILPPEDLGAEEIKDGFYTYMLKPMF